MLIPHVHWRLSILKPEIPWNPLKFLHFLQVFPHGPHGHGRPRCCGRHWSPWCWWDWAPAAATRLHQRSRLLSAGRPPSYRLPGSPITRMGLAYCIWKGVPKKPCDMIEMVIPCDLWLKVLCCHILVWHKFVSWAGLRHLAAGFGIFFWNWCFYLAGSGNFVEPFLAWKNWNGWWGADGWSRLAAQKYESDGSMDTN